MARRRRKNTVNYNQPGYVGWSMSERAVEAYDSGAMPLSKWDKSTMIDRIVELGGSICCAAYTLKDLRERCLVYDSWHHTSLYANETSFYRVDAKVAKSLTESAIRAELGDAKVDRIKAKAELEAAGRVAKRTEEAAFQAAHVRVPYAMLPEHRIEFVRLSNNKNRIVRVHSLDSDGNEIVSTEEVEKFFHNVSQGFLIPVSELQKT